ncbi:hypothetical protein E2C01_034658 [Portunus trituberculatus]|uniref:Uncharacterized protein n=1 Tax=Portunus trituberculatus TaxID=210409 RepID=A0A5B7F6A8_PORTR|nr:hypothetical protein [Portunus trituberculatus]
MCFVYSDSISTHNQTQQHCHCPFHPLHCLHHITPLPSREEKGATSQLGGGNLSLRLNGGKADRKDEVRSGYARYFKGKEGIKREKLRVREMAGEWI